MKYIVFTSFLIASAVHAAGTPVVKSIVPASSVVPAASSVVPAAHKPAIVAPALAPKAEEKVSAVAVDLAKMMVETSKDAVVLTKLDRTKNSVTLTLQPITALVAPERMNVSLGGITSLKFLKKDKPFVVTITTYEKSKKLGTLIRNWDWAEVDQKFVNLQDAMAEGRLLTIKVSQN